MSKPKYWLGPLRAQWLSFWEDGDRERDEGTRCSVISFLANLRFRKFRSIWGFRVFFFSAKTKNLINDAASRSLLRYQHSCSGNNPFLALSLSICIFDSRLWALEFPHLSFVIDQVARASAFGLGLIYGNVKLKALKVQLKILAFQLIESYIIALLILWKFWFFFSLYSLSE